MECRYIYMLKNTSGFNYVVHVFSEVNKIDKDNEEPKYFHNLSGANYLRNV